MLALTDNAVMVIRSLSDQQQIPRGGLRIATDPEIGTLTLSLAPEPVDGDRVVDTRGARLFLDSDAAQMLDDKALDAMVDDEGAVQFAVAEQPG
jgi:Fe-S cluster assembly iron-binding protein IscA